jgi:DNA-binding transcriptional ArsR family regulator
MSGENSQDSFSNDRAELFEALGHPTRIKILELLANSPMGFSDLKKALDIDSGGQLQFHLGKLHGLVKTVEGNYALTDEGKEALRIMAAKGPVKIEPKTRHSITPLQAITIVLAIALVFTMAFSLYNNQLQNQKFNSLNQSFYNPSIPAQADFPSYVLTQLNISALDVTMAWQAISARTDFQAALASFGSSVMTGGISMENNSWEIHFGFILPQGQYLWIYDPNGSVSYAFVPSSNVSFSFQPTPMS